MDSERWKRIDSLLHAAWERPAGEREAFLRQACGGDEALEREVLSLLASEQKAGSFLDNPVAAEWPELAGSTVTQLAGQTVSHYSILEMLGAGGMGVVYKAFDTKLNRLVALKFLPPHLRHDEELKGRLRAEARSASTLDHPNIVVIHDIDEAPSGDLFIAMAFHEGVTLRERISAAGSAGVPVAEALEIARQIAAGLARAHERGILHRDIKPGNVIVAQDGVTRIIDFGLAQPSDATATLDGSTKGTPLYMSPEQASGKALDCRTDLWSLGAVLYEMLAGRPPFDGEGHLAVMNAIVHAEPARLRTLRPDVPPEVEAIVAKALEKDPARRYQSAREMVQDLSAALAPGASPGSPASRRAFLIPAAAVALALAAAGYFYFHRTPKLTDKDTIVLADFLNKTGDPVFDGTLRQGLAVQLEQSPFLSLLSDERIQKTLPLMGKAAGAALTPAIAREICERTGGAAVLDGSIARIGSQYVLGLRARNCRTGDTLDEEQVQAARAEDVLNALSQIASKFRIRVGESLATVKTHDRPLAEVTTPSLEALKAYTASLRIGYTNGQIASVPLLQRAVEIDPNFALAYSRLAFSYGTMGEFALATESMKKAYALRDRASEKERYFITANYDTQVTGNLEKAQQTCELWAQTYPRDKEPHGLLSSLIYEQLGKYERSIEEGRTAVEIDPDFTPGYTNQVWSNLYLDRVEEAGNVLRQATARKLEMEDFFVLRYYIAFLKRDSPGMEQAAAVAQGKPAVEDWVLDEQAMALAYAGHRKQARGLSRRAIDMAKQGSHQEKAAIFEAGAAVTDAFFGYAPEARQSANAALALSDGRDVEYGAAFALALAGEPSRAQAIADGLEKRYSEDTIVRFTYVPALRALAALKNGEPQKAIDLLQTAVRYEVAVPGSWFGFFGFLYPAYVRGEAYLALHQYAEAAAEFRKITGHRGLVFCDPVGALAWWRLGNALALSGDAANAKAAYQEFFTLWKDADRDIPILQQAKAEFSRL